MPFKRGRRPSLTVEEKLRRQRDRWRRKKAKKRKETSDSKWLRATNYGYFERLEVLHWGRFVDYLIHSKFLEEKDRDFKARVESAADALLLAYVEERRIRFSSHNSLYGPNPNFRGCGGDGIGKVSIRITPGLVEALGLADQSDNRRKIKQAAEELLFSIYSNIADLAILDPWRTTGKYEQWPRAKARVGGMYNAGGLMEGFRARSYTVEQ